MHFNNHLLAVKHAVVISCCFALMGCESIYKLGIALSCSSRRSLEFQPVTLLDAVVGVSYSAKIEIVHGQTPIGDVYVKDDNLPKGLQIVHEKWASEATIVGELKEVGNFNFTLGAWSYGTQCPGQQGIQQYVLRVTKPSL